jgi:hypothetical protein
MVAMNTPTLWLVILAGACIGAPYLLGLRPTTRRQWQYIAVTLAFLAWVLPFMVSLRSR